MIHVHVEGNYFTWQEGQNPPPLDIHLVTAIWSDKAESTLIFGKFGSTIPWNYKSNGRQAWFGDIAKSIAYAIFRHE